MEESRIIWVLSIYCNMPFRPTVFSAAFKEESDALVAMDTLCNAMEEMNAAPITVNGDYVSFIWKKKTLVIRPSVISGLSLEKEDAAAFESLVKGEQN